MADSDLMCRDWSDMTHFRSQSLLPWLKHGYVVLKGSSFSSAACFASGYLLTKHSSVICLQKVPARKVVSLLERLTGGSALGPVVVRYRYSATISKPLPLLLCH